MAEARERIRTCLESEVAFCTAACPFRLDVRDFVEKMQRGSFDASFRTYRNTVGFPGIVSALCHEPCREVCPRRKTDGAISVRLLEKASIDHARDMNPTYYNVPKKSKRIAIIGAGISGLACALRLTTKKYDVTVFEQTGRVGGHLWGVLPPEVFMADIERQFMHEEYTVNLNTRIECLDDLDYDAIYVATGLGGLDFALLDGVTERRGPVAGARPGVFLGGSLLGGKSVEAIADGLRVANDIERYIKTGAMSSQAEPRQTMMELDPAAMSHAEQPVVPADGKAFTLEEAKKEAKRCLRCACDACIRHCDLMAFYGKFPRRIMDEVDITVEPATMDGAGMFARRLIATCNVCGLCGEVCPKGIDMGEFLLESRQAMHRKQSMPWAFHDFWLRDMAFANGESAHLAALPEGYSKSDYVLFPGCQIGASDPRYVEESYRYLLAHRPDTSLILSCCGAPAVWAGDEHLHQEAIARIREDWHSLGRPVAVLACPTCKRMFHDYLPEIETVFLFELMLQWGVTLKGRLDGRTFSVFDPCSSRDEPALRQSIRRIAEEAGCRLESLPYEGRRAQCCSWGGHVSIANPPYVKGVVEKRTRQNDNPYITSCTNCRDIFASSGKPVLHILDVVFDLNDDRRVPPTVTERWRNRAELKRNLLREFWPREASMEAMSTDPELKMRDELKQKISAALMLEKDILAVIEHCESTGRKVLDPATGHFFGYLQIGHMTYWVEYGVRDHGFELFNAYSHRMEIDLEEK